MDFRIQLTQLDGYCRVNFPAMACICEILLDTRDLNLALKLGILAQAEAQRIEQQFSRYRDDNIIARINQANGHTVKVDEETAGLLDFASELYDLSDGRFDITSGLLRRVWRFDGSDRLPQESDITALLPHIGWSKVRWQNPELQMPAGMEIDLGGIGKEYAVDKVFSLLSEHFSAAMLINFGGDLRARGPREDGSAWQVGVEKISASQPELLSLNNGAIATSGDSQRYLLHNGVRYSHILDPRSGWPVTDAPRAITVLAPDCIQAGVFSTLALMMGKDAEVFLEGQNVQFWSIR
ncbi:FAD:protein FMN transferase [Thalassolituus sp. ST750PaO-4]|uniref:FAD:protein FMN transferase n=1 Tax=Thalassolituus sp. ST750PaO-4 TaxID=2742965 RepID=UPI001CE3AB26|nr:FAD:protein FMN transferase [Thalassolituus sp. ST750PaO-4]MCA6059067.1 FAD:protein FMN transferase [Thalassolituus sp. ST750PaO-4]